VIGDAEGCDWLEATAGEIVDLTGDPTPAQLSKHTERSSKTITERGLAACGKSLFLILLMLEHFVCFASEDNAGQQRLARPMSFERACRLPILSIVFNLCCGIGLDFNEN
jgi:hypothetical protein